MTIKPLPFAAVALLLMTIAVPHADAARVKNLVEIRGFRDNPLVGYGLVVGLPGTGDRISSLATRRALGQLMRHLGTQVPLQEIRAQNVAMVVVTANLPPFARNGSRIDVTVSSMGTARSLQGGTLIATPLKGADFNTYALAQGAISVGGYAFEGLSGTANMKNSPNAGRVPGGGVIERDAPGTMPMDNLELLLRQPDFTTVARITEAINTALGGDVASARDGGAVMVKIGPEWQDKLPALVARIEAVEATPDAPARVVIDERTGTVVVGSQVSLSPAAVAHGAIRVKISESPVVSQPGAFAEGGTTTVVQQSHVEVEESAGEVRAIPEAVTVGDVAAALNALKVKPRDLIPILQALKAAGALHADIQML